MEKIHHFFYLQKDLCFLALLSAGAVVAPQLWYPYIWQDLSLAFCSYDLLLLPQTCDLTLVPSLLLFSLAALRVMRKSTLINALLRYPSAVALRNKLLLRLSCLSFFFATLDLVFSLVYALLRAPSFYNWGETFSVYWGSAGNIGETQPSFTLLVLSLFFGKLCLYLLLQLLFLLSWWWTNHSIFAFLGILFLLCNLIFPPWFPPFFMNFITLTYAKINHPLLLGLDLAVAYLILFLAFGATLFCTKKDFLTWKG